MSVALNRGMFPQRFSCYLCGQDLGRTQVRFDQLPTDGRVLPRCVQEPGCVAVRRAILRTAGRLAPVTSGQGLVRNG